MNEQDILTALWDFGDVTVVKLSNGTLLDGRMIAEFKITITERPEPPPLGVSVSDGVGTQDKFGG